MKTVRISVLVAIASLLCAGIVCAQQINNGDFEDGFSEWTTNYGLPYMAIADVDGDGDSELRYDGLMVITQNTGVLSVQDIPGAYVDLSYGVTLQGDVFATNLFFPPSPGITNDMRAFLKLEFLDSSSTLIPGTTLSSEYDPSTYATGNQSRVDINLVKLRRNLTNELAAQGKTLDDVGYVRAGCFLFRFDTNKVQTLGSAYFDNVSMGLVSASYRMPGLINGDFEYDTWGWYESLVSARAGALVVDIDNDADKELRFESDGLTGQYASRLWIQEIPAGEIDLMQGVSLTADLGATNLSLPGITNDLRVFHKLEFGTNGAPYSGGEMLPGVFESSEGDTSLFAATNETRLGSTITMTYENLTNRLHQSGSSATADDITVIRAAVFLMQFHPSASNIVGYGWVDNVQFSYTPKDPPDATNLAAQAGNEMVLTWNSEAGRTYRIQQTHDIYDYRWSNLVTGVAGQTGTTSYTNTLSGSAGFVRIRRE